MPIRKELQIAESGAFLLKKFYIFFSPYLIYADRADNYFRLHLPVVLSLLLL